MVSIDLVTSYMADVTLIKLTKYFLSIAIASLLIKYASIFQNRTTEAQGHFFQLL